MALHSLFEKTDKDNHEYLGKEHMRFCLEKTGYYLTLVSHTLVCKPLETIKQSQQQFVCNAIEMLYISCNI